MMRWLAGVYLLLALGCAPSAEEIQVLFEARVAESQSCVTDDECTYISPGCPLGCWVAVNTSEADALSAYAESLLSDYQSGGVSCAYGCIGPGEVACLEQLCAFVDGL